MFTHAARGRHPKRAAAIVLVGAALLAPAVFGASPALAAGPDTSDPGYWYYDDYGVAAAAADGFDGTGVKVAVIDGQINDSVAQLSSAKLTVREPSFCAKFDDLDEYEPATSTDYSRAFHGTDMVGLIAGNGTGNGGVDGTLGVAPGADVTFYSALIQISAASLYCSSLGDPDGDIDDGFAAAIETAIDDGNDIISVSIPNGGGSDKIYAAVARAVRENVVIVAARDNSTDKTTNFELPGMNGVVTVQAMQADGSLQASSTVADTSIDVVGPGVGIRGIVGDFDSFDETSGTSNAAAITAGFLAVVKSKYPDADGSQLIQNLIRNTGVNDHELTYDPQAFIGYGAVSLTHMLANDPTKYESVNPLLDTEDRARPTSAEIYGDAAPGQPDDPAGTTDESAISPATLVIGGLLGVLALAVVIVVIILVARRSSRRATGTP